jgi:radical SAM superfamily enzyme YgiQ (UPF0313 family)
MKGDLAFIEMIKELIPSADIITVGTVCKTLYEEILESESITAVVKGDVEVVIPSLVQAVLDKSELSTIAGIVYRTSDNNICVTKDSEPLSDLDHLPMPPYHKMPVKQYRDLCWGEETSYMPILDGRGCPFMCKKFCPYPLAFGTKPLYRNSKAVVDEVEYLHKQFGVEAFIFRSQSFTLNKEHARSICEEILQRDLHVKWLCETRLDSVDPDILKLMSSAGCKLVHYGLESGDPELFKSIGKPGCDLAIHGQSVEETKKAGMMPKLNVTIGLPGESWDSIHRTIKTVKKLKPDVVMASITTPYPGTEHLSLSREEKIECFRIMERMIKEGYPVLNLKSSFPYIINKHFKAPCYQCVIRENGRQFVCGRCIEVQGLCDDCGFLFAAEYSLVFSGNFKVIYDMVKTYIKYI